MDFLHVVHVIEIYSVNCDLYNNLLLATSIEFSTLISALLHAACSIIKIQLFLECA